MSSFNTKSNLVGRRYANAFLDLADDNKALKAIEGDMADLFDMLSSSDDLSNFLANPLLSKQKKETALAAIAKKAKLHKITAQFLAVLCRNGRADILLDTLYEAHNILQERRGETTAHVETAYALTAAQSKALKDSIGKSLGAKVAVNVEVNKDLLGGMVVTIGSKRIDGSLIRKLERLKLNLNEKTA